MNHHQNVNEASPQSWHQVTVFIEQQMEKKGPRKSNRLSAFDSKHRPWIRLETLPQGFQQSWYKKLQRIETGRLIDEATLAQTEKAEAIYALKQLRKHNPGVEYHWDKTQWVPISQTNPTIIRKRMLGKNKPRKTKDLNRSSIELADTQDMQEMDLAVQNYQQLKRNRHHIRQE